jgi:hypothetical protein
VTDSLRSVLEVKPWVGRSTLHDPLVSVYKVDGDEYQPYRRATTPCEQSIGGTRLIALTQPCDWYRMLRSRRRGLVIGPLGQD